MSVIECVPDELRRRDGDDRHGDLLTLGREHLPRTRRRAASGGLGIALAVALYLVPAAAWAQADRDYRYDNPAPAYPAGGGPVACFDSAHHNYHTGDGDFWPYAELLRGDGFVTRIVAEASSAVTLEGCNVLVIVTPVNAANEEDWAFPHASAFSRGEIAAVFGWVNAGGGLLLIADHSPIPGAMADLATVFGVIFLDGEARNVANTPLPDLFRVQDGTLHDHTITRGRSTVDEVEQVATWTGTAFRATRDFEPLMSYGPSSRAWVDLQDTFPHLRREEYPVFEAEGWLAAAARDLGAGRLVVLAETSMCTALRNDSGPWGMNTAAGAQNARFCLNAARWLSQAPVIPVR